jgi:hypothetical protein
MLEHQHTTANFGSTFLSIFLRACDIARRVYFGWADGAEFIFLS